MVALVPHDKYATLSGDKMDEIAKSACTGEFQLLRELNFHRIELVSKDFRTSVLRATEEYIKL